MTTTLPAAPAAAPPTTRRGRLRLVLTLGALVALGPLTIDMYLPALPALVDDLATTSATVQLTLTGTLAGLALGQLLVGPLSDSFGRRRPLLVGVSLHVLASLLCLVAPNIAVLGGLRVLQGLGAAAATVVAMAIVRDLFEGRAAATLFARLMLVLGVAPVLAPTIGGEVLRFVSWRGVFAVLAAIGLAMVVLAARAVPETLPPARRRPAELVATLRTYGGLLRDRVFVGLVVVAGLAMSGMFGYVAGSSFVFQGQFGLDEQQFGLLFGAGALFLIGGTQANAALLGRFEPRVLLPAALALALVADAVLVVVALTGIGGLAGVIAPLWVALFAGGLAVPNTPALALARHGEAAGTASAVLGATQMGVGAVVAPLVGVLGNDAVAMGAVMAGAAVLALVVLYAVVRPWTLADLDA
jgi:DHA1 family bicyclomycin/chloramphenicol resistance-like MFS transporter